ncbi:hypothetical protein [Nostoc sp. UHCC 0251]|uniref:hypothetical protein n=1 Tax=Nostoc sp. UHCC 0251 TaxID=3110240 RepID=UPI002B1EF3A3|nr:hypothetical protein [Nostoc sp. UHCC 0251]MEA5624696.1 hypothetical protein [Nostoc sp. UHCC 0251]
MPFPSAPLPSALCLLQADMMIERSLSVEESVFYLSDSDRKTPNLVARYLIALG